jgi:glycosyltransferase involved in cell wall biosynthesis
MKIAIDGRCLGASVPPGQAARYTQTLITRLSQSGLSPHVVYSASDPPLPERLACVRAAAPLEGRGWLWEQVFLPRFLHQRKFDLLHTPTQHARPPLWSPCPVLMTFHEKHNYSGAARGSSSVIPDRRPRRRVQHIVLARPFCASPLKSQFPGLTVVAPVDEAGSFDSINSGNNSALPGPPVREPYLLAADCGDIDLRFALTAFQQVRVSLPNLQFVIVCRSIPKVHVLEFVARCGLLLDEDVLFVLRAGGLLLTLSQRAELGIALGTQGECQWVVPAMARGLGFVSSSTGCAARVVGHAGTVVNGLDPAEIAGSIAMLLNADDRHQRALRAREQSKRFECINAADGTLDVYTALIGQGKRRFASRLDRTRSPTD